MNAFDRKNRPPPHPLEGLQSPFLDQEIFAGQGEEEWEPRLGALEAASPFPGAFELSGAGSAPPGAEWEEKSPFREAEGLFEAEGGITGEDDRTEVQDTKIAPYRWICSVTYEKDGQTLDGGSGLLISNRHVLTAAHVITEAGSGPSAPSLYVYPGRHYGGEPFGKFLAAKTRVPNFRMDFGLITLNRPVDPGLLWWGHPSTNTEWWSEAVIPFQELRQREFPVITAGYPGAKDAYRRRMYEARGVTVSATFGAAFRHTADTTQGQSGSPIWTERGGRRILIGIVRAFDQLPNQIGVFVHDRIVRGLVERWMAEDAPRPRPVERRIALEIPYRWVCRLEVHDNDLRRVVGYGTGLLISDRHVLTSARVIHGFSKDRRRYSVRIAPGYEFGKEALGSATASKARVSPRFSPGTSDASADYGLLTLSRPLGSVTYPAIGNAALGSWGGPSHGLSTSAADWSGKKASLAAFSRSSGGGAGHHKLRVSSGGIVGLKGGQILHRAGNKLDAPGAPIWVEESGKRLLVGIASPIFSKDYDVNWGCYLSQETRSHLMEWINEDYERKELEAGEHFSPDELESLPASPDAEAEGPAAEVYPEQELQDGYLEAESQTDDFLDSAELAETGYEIEQYAQPDEFRSNEEEYSGDYETEDAAVEGETFAGAEEYGDESELFEELVPLTLPAATPKLPSDAAMRSQLQAMGTAEARALDQAFASFGDFGKFVNRLPTALNAVYKPMGGLPEKHFVHVARLGAESFIYGAPRLEGNRYYPWVDYPDLNQAAESSKLLANFLHFSMSRLHQISRIATRPETHRRQMDRAGVLFRFFHTELASGFRRTGMAESLLLDYRTLLVQIIWLHYQRLLDGWLATAAKSRLPDGVIGTEWVNILRLAAITLVDDARALVPTFNLTATLYRDYFDQKPASDIGYLHYTSTPPPFTGHGPDMSFTTVFRRRVEQKALIEDLRKESGSAPLPNLHDSASWQAWVRTAWDKPQLRRESKLALVLGLVGRYFNAFTIHAPHDLREGCSEKNYLTRVFPRAVTGSLVHDCFVYACRWIHILGRLLTSGSISDGIAKPRIFLIEMPAHVGVMIRGETTFNRHIVVSINNKDAQIHEIDAGETDEAGAQKVVEDMYRGMKTPYVARRLTSKPADAKALWSEVCKLADKKLVLPYKDPKEPPHLRYLKHNALVARIGREFTDTVRASWSTLRQSLNKTGGGQTSADLVRSEIRKHTTRFESAIKSATDKIDSETKPLIKEINADLDAHKSRIPTGVLIVEIAPKALFANEVEAYRNALKKAVQTGDVLAINPDLFFPDNDFAAEVE
ncbi:serine protease [Geobacter sp.]|uniref:trypsin-like serine peptidase n=1 Tax=Geobacter sp. TaxID=46610 RepID=UPI0027BAAE06|nr:trypsin-like peptidase domain-containing protein [Geobacter sp.]